MLVKYKANLNAVDAYGNTPCHYSSQYGNGEVLGYLLKFNPKLYIKNHEFKTSIDVANNPEIIDVSPLLLILSRSSENTSTKSRWKSHPLRREKLWKRSSPQNSLIFMGRLRERRFRLMESISLKIRNGPNWRGSDWTVQIKYLLTMGSRSQSRRLWGDNQMTCLTKWFQNLIFLPIMGLILRGIS